MRWGDAVDVVQWARVNRGIDDYPAYVLDKMERSYIHYKNTAGFIDPGSWKERHALGSMCRVAA